MKVRQAPNPPKDPVALLVTLGGSRAYQIFSARASHGTSGATEAADVHVPPAREVFDYPLIVNA
jgi:hypothetical protein